MNIAGWEEKYRSGDRGKEAEPTALVVLGSPCVGLRWFGESRNGAYLADK